MEFFRKRRNPPPGPDYSKTYVQDVQRLIERGELTALLMLPEAFGGDSRPENVLYVPPFVADLKASFEANVVAPLVSEGKITRYVVTPEYAGRSIVPIAIKIRAFDPGDITYDLAIWGKALERDPTG